jgi:hypothetical protein
MQTKNGPAEVPMNTVRNHLGSDLHRSMCGRAGCIAIYRSEDCHLCDAMDSYLRDLVRSEGLPENVIRSVDQNSLSNEPSLEVIHSVPAMRVCETIITGLLDAETMKNTLRDATSKRCFLGRSHDSSTVQY